MHVDVDKVNAVINKYGGDVGYLIGILQDIQAAYNYLPREALELVSQNMEIPLSRVYGVATFFRAFSLTPRGRHMVTVCTGTACHVKGAPLILAAIERELGIGPRETSQDLEFSLETVNCLGSCAQAPLVVMDDKYHGKMTTGKITALLCQKPEKGNNGG